MKALSEGVFFRHSREGGNPVVFAALLPVVRLVHEKTCVYSLEWHNTLKNYSFKALDSRLRGNDKLGALQVRE